MVTSMVAYVRKGVFSHHTGVGEVTDGKCVEVGTEEVFGLIAEQVRDRITKEVGLHRYAAPAEPVSFEFLADDIIAVLLGDIKVVLEVLDNPS